MNARLRSSLVAVASFLLPFVLLAVVWQLAVELGWIDKFLVSSPSDVGAALINLSQDGELARGLQPTLVGLALSFALASIVGVARGLVLGWYRRLGDAVAPFVWFIYSAPVISLYPVFVISLGLGMATVIAIAFLLTISPVIVNTMRGVRDTN